MIENHYQSIRKQGPGIKYWIYILTCIAIAVLLYFFDKGAPLPPFDNNFQSIDCTSVKYKDSVDRNGQIDFQFYTDESVEFPPEYLPYFMTVDIKTEKTEFKYSGDQIENMTRDSSTMQFSVQHTFSGRSQFWIKCLEKNIALVQKNLSTIEIKTDDYSYSNELYPHAQTMCDACLEYEKFLYFTQIMGNLDAINFNKKPFRFEFLKWPLSAYLNHKNVVRTNGTSYMIAPFHKELWKRILFNINPIAYEMGNRSLANFMQETLFIFRDDPDPFATKSLSHFSSKPPMKLDPIQCFKELVMTHTNNWAGVHDKEEMDYALSIDFDFLRMRFPRKKTVPGYIAAPSKYAQTLKTMLPNSAIYTIRDDIDAVVAAEQVSKAKVLVGDHISSLINIVWMNKGSTVVDLSSESYSCNPWIKNLAQRLGINYYRAHESDKCECNDWSCYPEFVLQSELDSHTRNIIEELVK